MIGITPSNTEDSGTLCCAPVLLGSLSTQTHAHSFISPPNAVQNAKLCSIWHCTA